MQGIKVGVYVLYHPPDMKWVDFMELFRGVCLRISESISLVVNLIKLLHACLNLLVSPSLIIGLAYLSDMFINRGLHVSPQLQKIVPSHLPIIHSVLW